VSIATHPIDAEHYKTKFNSVFQHLERGDSFLTNLTVKTEVQLPFGLAEIFQMSSARYKILYRDEFLVFSPEIFVQIDESKIHAFPMKGTINSAIPDAERIILNDKKELAEHVTIVDLIRNDLSQVANNVRVKRFRYIDKITTSERELLQVSSEIEGDLEQPLAKLGTIIVTLLPAGSVSGAPKPKTVEIIREAEREARGYYTGVVGIFNGKMLDSGVMIRYIEHMNGRYYYRSGGGITTQSDCLSEYQEAIDKIYVPLAGID
jgi:para-aminobenzoate synthetase component 1